MAVVGVAEGSNFSFAALLDGHYSCFEWKLSGGHEIICDNLLFCFCCHRRYDKTWMMIKKEKDFSPEFRRFFVLKQDLHSFQSKSASLNLFELKLIWSIATKMTSKKNSWTNFVCSIIKINSLYGIQTSSNRSRLWFSEILKKRSYFGLRDSIEACDTNFQSKVNTVGNWHRKNLVTLSPRGFLFTFQGWKDLVEQARLRLLLLLLLAFFPP